VSRRAVGVALCGIAAFLFSTRYVATVILFPDTGEWNREIFGRFASYTEPLPWFLAGLALLVGLAHLVWAEIDPRP